VVGLEESTPLADMEEAGEVPLVVMADVAPRFFDTVQVDTDGARAVGFGRALPAEDQDAPGHDRPVAVLGPDGAFLALYRAEESGALVPVAVFV
jgi:tRNA pseudouridine55 synthase